MSPLRLKCSSVVLLSDLSGRAMCLHRKIKMKIKINEEDDKTNEREQHFFTIFVLFRFFSVSLVVFALSTVVVPFLVDIIGGYLLFSALTTSY